MTDTTKIKEIEDNANDLISALQSQRDSALNAVAQHQAALKKMQRDAETMIKSKQAEIDKLTADLDAAKAAEPELGLDVPKTNGHDNHSAVN